eukprot:UN23921
MDTHEEFTLSFTIHNIKSQKHDSCIILIGTEEVYFPQVIVSGGSLRLKIMVTDNNSCYMEEDLSSDSESHVKIVMEGQMLTLFVNDDVECTAKVKDKPRLREAGFYIGPKMLKVPEANISHVLYLPKDFAKTGPTHPFYMDCKGV